MVAWMSRRTSLSSLPMHQFYAQSFRAVAGAVGREQKGEWRAEKCSIFEMRGQ